MKQKFKVDGMSCSACSAAVEKAVSRLEGVITLSVSLTQGVMLCEYDETKLAAEEIVAAVNAIGYRAAVYDKKKKREPEKSENMPLRLGISIGFLLVLMYVAMGHMLSLPLPAFLDRHTSPLVFVGAQLLLAFPVLVVNRKFFKVGFKALWHRSPNMDSLVALGSTAAMLYGLVVFGMIAYGTGVGDHALIERYVSNLYVESSAMILTLVTVGKTLEASAKKKTGDAISALSSLSPKTASIIVDGAEILVSCDEVKVGDTVLIRPGEKLPVDGVILEGSSELDVSALTGESLPKAVTVGDEVMTASINLTGRFLMRALRVGEDTVLSEILEAVENASASKAPIARLADRVSGVFVPIVMALSLITGIVWLLISNNFDTALNYMISVLVISCPCALGLATPLAVTVAVGRLSSRGVLVKSAASLEAMARIDTVLLDKTGTVTEGKPELSALVTFDGEAKALLGIAASLEKGSEHSLAKAVLSAAEEKGITPTDPTVFEALPGKGVFGVVDGTAYYLGNPALMEEKNIDLLGAMPDYTRLTEEGKTVVILACEKRVLALLGIADTIRPSSKEAIDKLKDQGVSTVMLTGDRLATAKALVREHSLSFDTIVADVLPTDKASVVETALAEGKTVAMVGDGINDSPALAAATVGIAVGSATDIALDSADIVLLKNSLEDLPIAVTTSKKALSRIKENLFWAFFYNAIGIPIAAGVLSPLGIVLSPMLASAAMSLSSLFVVTNSLRLYRS